MSSIFYFTKFQKFKYIIRYKLSKRYKLKCDLAQKLLDNQIKYLKSIDKNRVISPSNILSLIDFSYSKNIWKDIIQNPKSDDLYYINMEKYK